MEEEIASPTPESTQTLSSVHVVNSNENTSAIVDAVSNSNNNVTGSAKASKKNRPPKKRKRETPKSKKNKVIKKDLDEELRPQNALNNSSSNNNNNQLTAPNTPLPVVYPFRKQYYQPNLAKLSEGQKLEKENSAPQIQLLELGMGCLNHKGYRTARCYFPCNKPGAYFYEATLPSNFQGHIRIGWSTEKGDLQAPAGYDKYGFCYRDIEGTAFHKARGKPYGDPFGPGDTIGCLIYLTDTEILRKDLIAKNPSWEGSKKKKSRSVNKAKELQEKQDLDDILLEGSQVVFYKNGRCQGVAFENVLKGDYYAAISLYMGAVAFVNFGTNLKFPVQMYNQSLVTLMSDLSTLSASYSTTTIEEPSPPLSTESSAQLNADNNNATSIIDNEQKGDDDDGDGEDNDVIIMSDEPQQ